jgi:5,10-methylenetetrahydrofolate reductase
VYDVQDEAERTGEERPFPFVRALDPFDYASEYLQRLTIPKIVYRPAGKFAPEELEEWLEKITEKNCYPVFVGVPSPDYIPKTSLKDAYDIWRKYEDRSIIGAVTIPERHAVLKDEDMRILDKTDSGVSYFVSQVVFNVSYAKEVLADLALTCIQKNRPLPTIIFTLTACGSLKTLKFMEWLGIHIPEELKEEMHQTENILSRSVEVCLEIAEDLIDYCIDKGVPFGFNIESVAIKKDEIEASILIVNEVGRMLREKGLR